VLDSRRTPALVSRPELVRRAQGFARLIALISDATGSTRVGNVDAPPPRIVGRSKSITSMLEWIHRAASTRLPVLILGETGSGKECVSRLIHQSSPRGAQPYVAFNCTALTETLLEAELFGSVRGAYTGSDRDRRGLFSVAHRGTLLLDEVGDMPPSMQAKLLRTLEEGRVRPVGAERDVPVDVRVVGATHHDLAERVRQGAFRADLFHRLAVIEIRVPPLRERLEDLPLLVESLAPRLEREIGRPVPPLDDAVLELLGGYDWPGNVRELHAVLARAMLRAGAGPILPHHLTDLCEGRMRTDQTAVGSEREMIVAALARADGSVTLAAQTIGWTRQKLYRRIKALSLERLL
jgi:transcriptional regulator with PAS, ATPase and Fis domain